MLMAKLKREEGGGEAKRVAWERLMAQALSIDIQSEYLICMK
jgi:hypothetical protein